MTAGPLCIVAVSPFLLFCFRHSQSLHLLQRCHWHHNGYHDHFCIASSSTSQKQEKARNKFIFAIYVVIIFILVVNIFVIVLDIVIKLIIMVTLPQPPLHPPYIFVIFVTFVIIVVINFMILHAHFTASSASREGSQSRQHQQPKLSSDLLTGEQ